MVRNSGYCKYSFKIELHEILGKIVGKNQKKRTFTDFSKTQWQLVKKLVYILADQLSIEQFSLTCAAAMQINCNKRKRLHKKRVQLPQYWFETQTWPPFQCSKLAAVTSCENAESPLRCSSRDQWRFSLTRCELFFISTTNKNSFFTPLIRNRNCLDSFCPPIS